MRSARRRLAPTGLALTLLAAPMAAAFAPSATLLGRAPSLTLAAASATTCECDSAPVVSGAPPTSDASRLRNPREALAESTVQRLDGSPVAVSDLLRDDGGVSLVVLTRSFGWPFCQEQILQYSQLRDDLLANDVRLSLISIGTPDVGKDVCAHLGVEGGDAWIYADPANDAYDRLELNRGWDTMASPATAFRFKDRIFDGKRRWGDEFGTLFEVLGKWRDGGFFVPPKVEQSTIHGGTFVFDGEDGTCAFAHYDASPGTHADARDAAACAIKRAKSKRAASGRSTTMPRL